VALLGEVHAYPMEALRRDTAFTAPPPSPP
jgi:hypothetical protein